MPASSISGVEIFASVACGIALGEAIGSLIRYAFHRRTLADLSFHHRMQIGEIAALHKAQRDDIAETILRVRRGGAEVIPLNPVRH